MKFNVNKNSFLSFSLLFILSFSFIWMAQNSWKKDSFDQLGIGKENRVIKCTLELEGDITENLFYVAHDIKAAKQMLFNSKSGLFFDNGLYVKTTDYNGKVHIVDFETIECDSVGRQLSMN